MDPNECLRGSTSIAISSSSSKSSSSHGFSSFTTSSSSEASSSLCSKSASAMTKIVGPLNFLSFYFLASSFCFASYSLRFSSSCYSKNLRRCSASSCFIFIGPVCSFFEASAPSLVDLLINELFPCSCKPIPISGSDRLL